MKRAILTIILLVCSIVFIHVNGQTTTSFGVKLNGNLTNVKLSKIQKDDNSFRAGASIGGFTKIEFTKNFALQPEILLNYTEKKEKNGEDRIKYKYASVEIPIYALAQFEIGRGKIFAGIGPHIGYGFSADSRKEGLNDNASGANKVELSHWYMGGGIITGYEFENGLILHAGYQLGYDLSSNRNKTKMDTQTISLGIGYKF